MAQLNKAGSLIITRPIYQPEENQYFDYQILLLKRQESLPYGGAYQFSGGPIDKQDIYFVKNNLINQAKPVNELHTIEYLLQKSCALRKLYEDTGLFLQSSSENNVNIEYTLANLKKGAKNSPPSFRDVANALPSPLDEDEIIELVRLVNPINNKQRYDTQYFIANLPQNSLLNISQGLQDSKKVSNLDDIVYDENYENMIWASPVKIIKMYLKKEINLNQTQYLILNLMTSFKTQKDLVSYLKNVQYFASNSFSENIIEKRPLTLPFNMAIVKTPTAEHRKKGISHMVCFEADYDYPFLEMIKRQKDAKYKQELKQLYGKIRNDKEDRLRFYFSNKKASNWLPVEAEVNLGYDMPLKMVKGYEDLKASLGYGRL